MDSEHDPQRAPTRPPGEFENDEAAREFGRQLAMDSLLGHLHEADQPADKTKIISPPIWLRLSAAAAIVLGLLIWQFFPGGGTTTLAAGWEIEPIGDARFSIIDPARIRLERGELLVYSTADSPGGGPATITIETENAAATASGTRFYVGAHQELDSASTPNPPIPTMKKLTRILVLSGTVSLTTAGGSAVGNASELLVAENANKPTNLAVQGNSEFAIDLYQRLAGEDANGNLFFSPFSVSSALAMVAEGARGHTALEMGKVLHFPNAARRVAGDDAQRIPWETAKIHAGMAELNKLLNRQDQDTPEVKAIRHRISKLRLEHTKLKVQIRLVQATDNWEREGELAEREAEVVAELNRLLPTVDQYELQVANALWGERSYPFRADYAKAIEAAYGTVGAFPTDFKGDSEAERKRINGWVAENTNNRIQDLLAPGSINSLTSLVVTNAIYFRGNWESPFEEKNTKQLDFFTAPGKPIKTATMGERWLSVGRYGAFEGDGSVFDTPVEYAEGQEPQKYPGEDGFALMELPYKGGDLSMVVLAPNRIDGLPAITKSLTAAKLDGWIAKLKRRETHVYLPKFKAETSYGLKDRLGTMGMGSAFTSPSEPGGADFSGMAASLDPNARLYLSDVVHKAFISVNEKGTEAAAATAAMMLKEEAAPVRLIKFTPTFRADRPFLFLIRDKRSGSILFLGRITRPGE